MAIGFLVLGLLFILVAILAILCAKKIALKKWGIE